MSHFDILKTITPDGSYRCEYVRGRYDFRDEAISQRFVGDMDLPDAWDIGAIIGPSGSGKSTIAKEIFRDDYIAQQIYDARSVIDNMPDGITPDEIAQAFCAVGFASVPSWFKPYHILSNGEKARVDIARAFLNCKKTVCLDEYTSVIDRKTAQLSSIAVEKYVRRMGKQFVAVTCHYDIIDWLRPDWVFDTENMELEKKTSRDENYDWKSTNRASTHGRVLRTITI